MMKSMTSFASFSEVRDGKEISVEIRSVNNRFLDCSVRIPRKYNVPEDRVRAYLKDAGVHRGKVDVQITVAEEGASPLGIVLDEEYLEGYLGALYQLRDKYGLKDDISVMTVARDARVFRTPDPEEEGGEDRDFFTVLQPTLDGAIRAFLDARTREGQRLEQDLRQKLAAIEQTVSEMKAMGDALVQGYRARLEERLSRVLIDHSIEIDQGRVLTECAIFADRVAIDEELVRLSSHFRTFEEIAASEEPAGRKLDFLLQEINREVNTIGSKCSDAGIAKLVVNVKNELEKIREQVQNIE